MISTTRRTVRTPGPSVSKKRISVEKTLRIFDNTAQNCHGRGLRLGFVVARRKCQRYVTATTGGDVGATVSSGGAVTTTTGGAIVVVVTGGGCDGT